MKISENKQSEVFKDDSVTVDAGRRVAHCRNCSRTDRERDYQTVFAVQTF